MSALATEAPDGLPRLYGTMEVERSLHIAHGTVKAAVRRGHLVPAAIPGKKPKFTAKAVQDWIDGRWRDGEPRP
ncbi:hypothetical protein [uncultured Parolsenella sp.]|uniref:hypothetical protein n=1 Tax=uncultured Parolsenella sp. TaxID=2083008 RepID=UPI0025CFD407|nr:hypothetical protein [uncultured Parolsenella sp.]